MNTLEEQWECEHLELEEEEIELDQYPEQQSLTIVKTYFCKNCGMQVEV
jgi:hypothetical protein